MKIDISWNTKCENLVGFPKSGHIFFSLLFEMSFYQNPVTHCNIAIYCNILKHNIQFVRQVYVVSSTIIIIIIIIIMAIIVIIITHTETHTNQQ